MSFIPKNKVAHIQKYDGLENIEIRSPALDVTLASSTDTNLGHNHTKISQKNVWGGNFGLGTFESHFLGE